jgi:hypothetical protein
MAISIVSSGSSLECTYRHQYPWAVRLSVMLSRFLLAVMTTGLPVSGPAVKRWGKTLCQTLTAVLDYREYWGCLVIVYIIVVNLRNDTAAL